MSASVRTAPASVRPVVQSVQETLLTLAVMSVLSHERAGDRVIFLFHMRVVILVVGTGTGERDTSGMTESVETGTLRVLQFWNRPENVTPMHVPLVLIYQLTPYWAEGRWGVWSEGADAFSTWQFL